MKVWEHRQFYAAASDAPTGSVEEPEGVSDGAAATPNGAWYESFSDEGLKANPSITKYKTAEEAAKGIANLVSNVGVDKISKPRADDPEDMQRFLDEVGMRPATADQYTLKEGTELPAQWDNGVAMRMIQRLHESGASQQVFEEVMDGYINEQNAATQIMEQRSVQGSEKAHRELDEKYGLAKKEALDVGNRALTAVLGDDAADIMELRLQDGTRLCDHMPLIHRFIDYGKSLGEDANDGGNPKRVGGMTPAAAKKELQSLKGDKEWNLEFSDRKHAGHASAVERFNQLQTYANPPKSD